MVRKTISAGADTPASWPTATAPVPHQCRHDVRSGQHRSDRHDRGTEEEASSNRCANKHEYARPASEPAPARERAHCSVRRRAAFVDHVRQAVCPVVRVSDCRRPEHSGQRHRPQKTPSHEWPPSRRLRRARRRAIPPPDSVIRPWCRKSAAAGRDYASSPPRASSMPDSTSSNIVASGASVRPWPGRCSAARRPQDSRA